MEEDEIKEAIEEYDGSIHALIDELLKEFYTGEQADVPIDALAVRKKRLESKLDKLKLQKEEIKTEIDSVENELEIIEDVARRVGDSYINKALKNCRLLPQRQRVPTNEAIQTQAEKIGITPERFIELLDERYPTDRFGDPIELSDEEV